MQLEDGYFSIQTDLESFEPVRKALIAAALELENASLQWIAKNNISIKGDEAEKVMRLIEAIEDNDDVQNVFTNADIDEETINQTS